VFAGYGYLPYDAGLSLYVRIDEAEWYLPLQLYPEAQKHIAENLLEFLEATSC
jgi:hypothetical protein